MPCPDEGTAACPLGGGCCTDVANDVEGVLQGLTLALRGNGAIQGQGHGDTRAPVPQPARPCNFALTIRPKVTGARQNEKGQQLTRHGLCVLGLHFAASCVLRALCLYLHALLPRSLLLQQLKVRIVGRDAGRPPLFEPSPNAMVDLGVPKSTPRDTA